MAKAVRISDAEWQVMETLWERSPRTAAQVVGALSSAEAWSPRTIKTMLNRLIKKKAIAFEAEGKMYLYRPIVPRVSAVRAQSVSFVQRVFRGEIKPMLAYFVESETLSPQDIADLRKILARKGR